GRLSRKVAGIELPQRLHGRVEGACGQRVEAPALLDERDEFRRWRFQYPAPVERDEGGILPVEAEERFEAAHLRDGPGGEPLGRGPVPVVDPERRDGAE